jgi:hypothetical protein
MLYGGSSVLLVGEKYRECIHPLGRATQGRAAVAAATRTSNMDRMESHISAARAMETFPEVVERVRTGGEVFVVECDGEAVCRIEPIVHPRLTVRGLIGVLRSSPRPDDEYLDAVEQVARNQPEATEMPWE